MKLNNLPEKLLAELKDSWNKKSHHEVNLFLAGFSNLKPLCSTLALGTTICMASSFTPKNTGDTGNLSTYLNFEVPWVEIPGRYFVVFWPQFSLLTYSNSGCDCNFVGSMHKKRACTTIYNAMWCTLHSIRSTVCNNTICPKRNHFFLKRECLIT